MIERYRRPPAVKHIKCCKRLKVYWYHLSANEIILMCQSWKPHDKWDFVKLGKI